MSGAKISLVIPAYNEENYIDACLDHAINNSGGQFCEIIVVDNASIDRTAEVAARHPGVRVVREAEKGTGHARERGWREARGDIIAYIDADCHTPPGWVEKILGEFARQPRLACLSGPCYYHDLPRWQQALVNGYWRLARLPYRLTGYMMLGGNCAIRREVLEKLNGFDTSIAFYGDDTDLARRASKFGQVKFKSDFIIHTSGRRLTKQGMVNTGFTYGLNFFSQVFARRTVTKNYLDIR
ncbi:MAG: glycosyltransferase family 2 protein [Candidatus Vogelbacteria bacterium]|nr:glycosyltransferase family 2 protein [Candidatus Vogelbacteria bacterium]